MTVENTTATPQALVAGSSGLPLRQDDPISMAFIIKTMLVMAVLLLIVYLALRWYSRRGMATPVSTSVQELHCVRELRLSPRTKTYLLNVDGAKVLVTESTGGVTVTPLQPSAATQPDSENSV